MAPLNEDDDFADPTITESVSAWVDHIDETLEVCAEKWRIEIGYELMMGMKGYLTQVRRADGSPAVLKLRSPDEQMHWEIQSLQAFDGEGSVRLYDTDVERGALLLEWVDPGDRMESSIGRTDIDAAAGELMSKLWREPAGVAVPTLEERALRWADNTERMDEDGPFPSGMRRDAAALMRELAGTQADETLLHADLYVQNILKGTRDEWVAVDPKGAIGERCFDVAWWLRCPFRVEVEGGFAPVKRALDMLVETYGVDRERTVNWAWSVSVAVAMSRVAAMMPSYADNYAAVAMEFRALA